jgi:hypothetical protein
MRGAIVLISSGKSLWATRQQIPQSKLRGLPKIIILENRHWLYLAANLEKGYWRLALGLPLGYRKLRAAAE